MRKTILALTMAAFVLALSACSDKDVKGSNEILATTKAGDITSEELVQEMKDSIGVQVFQNLVLKKAIENEFKVTDKELKAAIKEQKEEIGDEIAFKAYLEQSGITEDVFEKQFEFSLLQKKLIDSLDEVPEEQIKAEYDKMKKEIHARHILLEDEETANKVIADLKDGGDFAKLAKEYSTEEVAQETGGDLGWFGLGKMIPEFEEVAFALEEKVISEPVKTSFGYHVIEVLESRDAEIEGTLEELTPKIEEGIKATLFEDKLTELLKNADVKIKDESFKGSLDEFLKPEEK
ncbi:peptidylprolyl isomerase [Sporosarcina sp. G11-34]|uniref:peptidylprolyl isomerase n=1 Tax=Sporosarcina sp. G11-34 TaxID=2849605 RepID=UPI0022A97055|nr:peptidylprolyl isomerase [Sporosarcina sp. G11-34]MCZ2260027.1 peptidylprolyl isomerase [Sporosarcina sp. G11-34]